MRTLCVIHDAGAGLRAGDRVPRLEALQQAQNHVADSGSEALHLPALPLTRIRVSSAPCMVTQILLSARHGEATRLLTRLGPTRLMQATSGERSRGKMRSTAAIFGR